MFGVVLFERLDVLKRGFCVWTVSKRFGQNADGSQSLPVCNASGNTEDFQHASCTFCLLMGMPSG